MNRIYTILAVTILVVVSIYINIKIKKHNIEVVKFIATTCMKMETREQFDGCKELAKKQYIGIYSISSNNN